ncbi:MAG: hypothetical protein BWX61_00374 [Bacteroidetes bacterium ADurb.Bin035]|nr:MAG: hypothetical protein BWX61_00374 [Bacteroidetes bacterium ADurb.Bin035]
MPKSRPNKPNIGIYNLIPTPADFIVLKGWNALIFNQVLPASTKPNR